MSVDVVQFVDYSQKLSVFFLAIFILVLQLTYELLGLIAREYPDCLLNDYETQIRDLFFLTLEKTLLNQQEVNFPQNYFNSIFVFDVFHIFLVVFLSVIERCIKWLYTFPNEFRTMSGNSAYYLSTDLQLCLHTIRSYRR